MVCGVSRWRGWGVGQACRRFFGGWTWDTKRSTLRAPASQSANIPTTMVALQHAGRAPPASARVVAAKRVVIATAAPRANRRPSVAPPPSLALAGQRVHYTPRSLPDADLAGSGDTGIVSVEARALRRLAWASFWSQLALSLVAAVVLWFCVGVERSAAAAPPALATACTTLGTAAALVSTFIAFGLTRATRGVLLRGDAVRRSAVAAGALAATRINLWGLGAALIGLQATIGGLVGRVLVSATANPLAAGGTIAAARVASAPAALDVFALQASANALLAHFASIVFATWVIRLVRAAADRERNGGAVVT